MAGGSKGRKGGKGGGGGGGSALPDGVKLQDDGHTKEYVFKVAGNEVTFVVQRIGENKGGAGFDVNGDLDRGSLKGRDADKAALKIARIMKYDVATRPEGFKYRVYAHTDDGFGDRRAQGYSRAGFSTPKKAGDAQFAVVKGGKLQAITETQF